MTIPCFVDSDSPISSSPKCSIIALDFSRHEDLIAVAFANGVVAVLELPVNKKEPPPPEAVPQAISDAQGSSQTVVPANNNQGQDPETPRTRVWNAIGSFGKTLFSRTGINK